MTPPPGVATAISDTRPYDPIPPYLKEHYWWAYIHPRAIRLFERQWLVNLILYGYYRQLRDWTLSALGRALPGRTLQVACVYGDMTRRCCERVSAGGGQLDVVDVLPVQLENLRHKLPSDAPVRLIQRDSSNLGLPDGSYDRVILFFLLHEQPADVRRRTVSEAFRVVKPGGRIILVDFSPPSRWHPLKYVWLPVLGVLEPFAHDLWGKDISAWLPPNDGSWTMQRTTSFGGLYQQIIIQR